MLSMVIKSLHVTPSKIATALKKHDIDLDKRPSEFDLQSIDKRFVDTANGHHNGEERARIVLSPCGRCWPKAKLISFWDKRRNVPIGKIESVINAVGLGNTPSIRIEFIDDKPVRYEKKWTYDDLVKGFENTQAVSDKEVNKLMAKMHTIATSKQVKPGFGSMCDKIPWSKFCKSEAILTEDPDTVLGPDNREVKWYHPQAIAFLFINGKCVTGDDLSHWDMIDILKRKNLSSIRNLGIHGDLNRKDLDTMDKIIETDEEPGANMRIISILNPVGRAWPHINTISFWSRRRNVKRSHINAICSKVGIQASKARLEFIDHPDEFFGVDDFSDAKSKNQSAMSDSEVLKLQAKLHMIATSKQVKPGFGSRADRNKFRWSNVLTSESMDLLHEGRSFWGKEACGVIVKRPDGKVLMLQRSGSVMGTGWGIPGGRIEEGDTIVDTLRHEALEEMGGLPKGSFSGRKYVFRLALVPGDTYEESGDLVTVEEPGEDFTYTTLEYVTTEEDWEPELNWEHDDFGWFTPQEAMKLKSLTQRDEKGNTVWPVKQMLSSLYGGKHAI